MSTMIPVLMYHSVTDCPAAATGRLSVRPAVLAAQLGYLRQQGFTTLTFSRLAAALRDGAVLPPRPVVLTFDDGYADFHEAALPLLIRYGAVATVFVTTGWVADAAEHAAGTPLGRMLSWNQIAEVSAAGFEVGAHSHSHAQLDQLPDAALHRELRVSKLLLEERLGREVPCLAYPYGYSSARVREAVHVAGYRHAAAVSNAAAFRAATRPRADLFALPRLTIRRSTSLAQFQRITNGHGIWRIFLMDRTLTAGMAVVRRGRYAVSGIRGR
jgi:peptidoglycan/xylan/chitin deacetylase (PgdA/CDA1 family)